MEKQNLLMEWALSKWQDKKKRSINSLIFLLLFLFLFLVNINFLAALAIDALLIVIWNYIYSKPQQGEDSIAEAYKITKDGIFIDSSKENIKNFYPWTDLSYFYSVGLALPFLGILFTKLASDNLIIVKIDGKLITLKTPNRDTASKVGLILSQRMPFKMPNQTKYPADVFYDTLFKRGSEKNNLIFNNKISETQPNREETNRHLFRLILMFIGIFFPLILVWGLSGDTFKNKDFKKYMPREKIDSISIPLNEIVLKKDDKGFDSLINAIYKIDTSENLSQKIELFFYPASRTEDVIQISYEKFAGLNQKVFYMDICSIDNYCLSADYNSTSDKITLNYVKPVKGDLTRDSVTILKSYNIDLDDQIKEILAQQEEIKATNKLSEQTFEADENQLGKTDEYWYAKGWPKKEMDLIACKTDENCAIYYYGRNFNVRDLDKKPYSGINYFDYVNACWWGAVNKNYKNLWWERYPKPENCPSPFPDYAKAKCLSDIKICQYDLQMDRIQKTIKPVQ